MKTWKQGIFGILAIIVLVFALTACDKDEGDPQPKDCKCLETYGEWTHLEEGKSCDCDADAGKCTNCTTKVNATTFGETTKVWKEVGVSVDDFNAIVDKLDGIWLMTTDPLDRGRLNNGITEIRIAQPGTGIARQNRVLWIECDTIGEDLFNFLLDEIIFAQVQQSKGGARVTGTHFRQQRKSA